DQPLRDDVVASSGGEDDRRQLARAPIVDASDIHCLHERGRARHPEVGGHQLLEKRPWAPAVTRTDGRTECGTPEPAASVGAIARQLAEGGEADDPAIRADA